MGRGAEDAAGIEGVAVVVAWFMACMVRRNKAQVLNEFDIAPALCERTNPRTAVRESASEARAQPLQ
jgi:hypothetical protein